MDIQAPLKDSARSKDAVPRPLIPSPNFPNLPSRATIPTSAIPWFK